MSYEVAVRVLCELTAKRGDLDMRFTPSPSAQEGVAGHRTLAARRGARYEKEISVAGDFRSLRVRGRADGYDPDANRIEEFKTFRGDLSRMPENHRALHWAQLRIYAWLLCHQRGLSEIQLCLVYFDIASEQETVLGETQSATALQRHFVEHCERFIRWAESESAHRLARDAALSALRFPHDTFHEGQRELSEAVYRTVRAGRTLLAQAPTGIGKTIGTLFPALKALPPQRLDKLFFLVAKTSGRKLALDALRQLKEGAAPVPLRVVELVAREKACEHPGTACEGAACPLARGFYDRLADARAEAVALEFLDRHAVRGVALRHGICPYYLSQELARWSDVVVGDYNYYFDLNAMLHGWTAADGWRVSLLVDEAHNLIERARKMYTASLEQAVFDEARRDAPASIKPALERIARVWNSAVGAQSEAYCVYEQLPDGLLGALEKAVAVILDHLSVSPVGLSPQLQAFFFDALHFCRLAADFDAGTLFEVHTTTTHPDSASSVAENAKNSSVLRLRNIVPRRYLAPRFATAHASVLFSATLAPHAFFRDVLGLPNDAQWIDVRSPFHADQLAVRLVSSISTRFRDRERSLAPIARIVASQYHAQPGNYLAFFSSFDYLNRVAELFEAHHPAIPVWKQTREMTEPERTAFLEHFALDGQGIGFAVLGGAFAEGIDLPGSRLIGAFIATLGLPQINAVNEEMQRRMHTLFGTGFEYTYLYPGIQKVVQAAGRVIRARSDRGVLYLIDDRFTRAEVHELLPAWWRIGGQLPVASASGDQPLGSKAQRKGSAPAR